MRGKGLASRPGGHFQNAGPGFANRVYDFILQRFEQKTKRLQKSVKVEDERS